jgi:hypothetical protein
MSSAITIRWYNLTAADCRSRYPTSLLETTELSGCGPQPRGCGLAYGRGCVENHVMMQSNYTKPLFVAL